MNQLVVQEEKKFDLTIEVEQMQQSARKLMQSKHYQKMGEDGIFAICMTAKAMGISQLDALNGEMFYIQGKVGMSYEAMNKYIRMAGHSVILKHLDDKSCTLIGKRKDTGDTAEITYTMDDAKRAGKSYDKYPKSMLFARCISMLKRFLFPDVCTKIYVKEELEDLKEEDLKEEDFKGTTLEAMSAEPIKIEKPKITSEQENELEVMLEQLPKDYDKTIRKFVKTSYKCETFSELNEIQYNKLKDTFILKMEMLKKQPEIANEEIIQE